MARGFLSGLIWGGVVSVAGAGVVSVLAEGPVAPDVAALAPQAEPAPQIGDPSTADAITDADLVREGEVFQNASPQVDDVTAVTVAGSDTPTVPETGGADGLSGPAQSATDGAVAVQDAAPVLPSPQASLPSAPRVETELSISTDPAQPPAPSVPDGASAFDAGGDGGAVGAIPVQPAEPVVPELGQTGAAGAPVETVIPVVPPPPGGPEGDALAALPSTPQGPTIGQQATSLVDRNPEARDAIKQVQTKPPLQAFAAPFENESDRPLMSIVLIDTGVDLTGGPVGIEALNSFPYPLSFAVNASLPDATERMADYRARGFEVLTVMNLPQGATASDAEVALASVLADAPEAVAVMEGVGVGVQGSRDTSDQITQALKASGHGLVLQSKGLNTAQKLALREGVPIGLIFRDFDSAGQSPTVIRRFLDQAAFRAGQEGGVIMVGRLRPDTISALLLWGLQDRAQRVALAPVSAVLTALAESP